MCSKRDWICHQGEYMCCSPGSAKISHLAYLSSIAQIIFYNHTISITHAVWTGEAGATIFLNLKLAFAYCIEQIRSVHQSPHRTRACISICNNRYWKRRKEKTRVRTCHVYEPKLWKGSPAKRSFKRRLRWST